MSRNTVLSEKSMLRFEAQIPALAAQATHKAYLAALTLDGKVVEARNGLLLETSAEGESRVLRCLTQPLEVEIGMKRVRVRK